MKPCQAALAARAAAAEIFNFDIQTKIDLASFAHVSTSTAQMVQKSLSLASLGPCKCNEIAESLEQFPIYVIVIDNDAQAVFHFGQQACDSH